MDTYLTSFSSKSNLRKHRLAYALLAGAFVSCAHWGAQAQPSSMNTNAPAPGEPQGRPERQRGAPNAPTYDGNIGQITNVPTPAKPPRQEPQETRERSNSQAQANQGWRQPNSAAPQPPGNQTSAAQPTDNGASMQALPSPKIDVTATLVNRVAPANPEQIRGAVEEISRRTGAATLPPNNAFVGRASQYTVDLSPGASPPVVRVAKGMGATVNFVDTAGNPWPIEFANNFYAEAATVTQMAPHVLSVAANSPHLSGSVGVMLTGLTTPVNFVVTPAQSETDFRVDLRIVGLSPNAVPVPGRTQSNRPKLGSSSVAPGAASDDLMGFMYGGTPNGATRLQIELTGSIQLDTRAWQTSSGKLIVRTAALIQSPGWYQRLPALDGTAVYEMPPTPILRVSVDGNTETIRIKGLSPDGDSSNARSNTAGARKTSLSNEPQ